MNPDTLIGALIALVAICTGAIIAVVAYWIVDSHRGRPPGWGDEAVEPGPPPDSLLAFVPDVPDYVPDEWVREAA